MGASLLKGEWVSLGKNVSLGDNRGGLRLF